MNSTRRKELRLLAGQIEEIKGALENLKEEEESYQENMPEGLQGSKRYEQSIDAVDNMESAMEALDEALSSIESAQE